MNRFLFLPFWFAFLVSAPSAAQLIIAHRGASSIAPENTLVAFKKAIELGAHFIELDVHQTRDSHLVVIHDETVDRTTDGKGRIGDLTAAEVRTLDAGGWFSPEFGREKIPLLEEVFDTIPDSVSLLIEIKQGSDIYPGIERRIVQLVRNRNAAARVVLKSFDNDVLDRLRILAPEIPRLKIIVMQIPMINIIIERGLNVGNILEYDVQYLQVHWFGLSNSFVEKAHRKGYKVFAWDVHDEKRMREMIEKRVDGIETDYPDVLRALVHQTVPR